MAEEQRHALSDLLDTIENAAQGDSITVDDLVKALGQEAFASLLLVFTLISTSPASAIPGLTATVAVIVFILVAQMIVGRTHIWLPGFVTRKELPTGTIRKGIGWLRKPVQFVEKFLKPRLTFLFHRPFVLLPLILILGLALFMPLMEIIPTSGSIASPVIALFAAGLLTALWRV